MYRLLSPLLVALPLLSCAAAPDATRHVVAEGALGPYSGAVIAGDFAFISGKIGERGGSFEREAETAIEAVRNELAGIGLDLSDVVEARVFLTDMGRYADFNAVYGRLFSRPYPARACVAVAALPGEARVEVQVVARLR